MFRGGASGILPAIRTHDPPRNQKRPTMRPKPAPLAFLLLALCAAIGCENADAEKGVTVGSFHPGALRYYKELGLIAE